MNGALFRLSGSFKLRGRRSIATNDGVLADLLPLKTKHGFRSRFDCPFISHFHWELLCPTNESASFQRVPFCLIPEMNGTSLLCRRLWMMRVLSMVFLRCYTRRFAALYGYIHAGGHECLLPPFRRPADFFHSRVNFPVLYGRKSIWFRERCADSVCC